MCAALKLLVFHSELCKVFLCYFSSILNYFVNHSIVVGFVEKSSMTIVLKVDSENVTVVTVGSKCELQADINDGEGTAKEGINIFSV